MAEAREILARYGARFFQDDFGLLNLNLRFDSSRAGWYVFASARNLLDADYFTQIFFQSAPGYPSQPDHTEKRILFDLLAAEEIDVALERGGLEQQLTRALENEGAGCGRRDLRAAVEQAQSELRLGRLDASCQGRLGQMHLLGCTREVAGPGDGNDVGQPFEIHNDAPKALKSAQSCIGPQARAIRQSRPLRKVPWAREARPRGGVPSKP